MPSQFDISINLRDQDFKFTVRPLPDLHYVLFINGTEAGTIKNTAIQGWQNVDMEFEDETLWALGEAINKQLHQIC